MHLSGLSVTVVKSESGLESTGGQQRGMCFSRSYFCLVRRVNNENSQNGARTDARTDPVPAGARSPPTALRGGFELLELHSRDLWAGNHNVQRKEPGTS